MKHFIFIAVMACAGASIGADAVREVSIDSHGLHVRADGVGKEAFDDVKAVIEEQTALTQDEQVTPPLADDLAFFVRQRYLELGYREAAVTWDIAGDAALLHVKEGRRYDVGVIKYEGNTSQNEDDLTNYLLRPTHEKLKTSSKNPPFVEADLRAGAELVQRFFQAQGYLDASVGQPVFTPHPDTAKEDVLLRVKEGTRYEFGELQVLGELEGQEKATQKPLEELQGPFSEVKVENARKAIAGIYQELGHFSVVVTAMAEPSRHQNGVVPVEFRVAPGPRYHVATIDVAPSFSAGAQRLVRASYMPAEGRIYSPAELEVMHRRLLDTEVFSRIEVKPKPGEEATLALDLTGEEAKRTTLSAYAGYETFQGPILGLEARQVNFMDSGDAVRVKAEANGRGYNGAVKWLDPAIFNSAFSFDVELAAQTFNVFDYERRTLGLRGTLARHWDRHISSNLFAEVSVNRVTSDKLSPEELGPADYKLATAGAALIFDYRDSPVLPTKGWYAGATIADAFGGDTKYLRSDIVFSYYQPITKKFRAAFTARSSAIHSSGGVDDVPIDLRLFNGGAYSVRSFAEREMGDRSKSGTPLGGTLSQVFSAEFSYEVASNLELAIFTDAGKLSPVRDNLFSAPTNLHYAIGAGLRYKLPIGPLRIDYGYNPRRRDGEPVGALHITFGFAF